jgi:hypothetical protein
MLTVLFYGSEKKIEIFCKKNISSSFIKLYYDCEFFQYLNDEL